MGEAHHLEDSERVLLIKTARQALDAAGFSHAPIIAGTGVGSTRKTIELTRQAAEAGADYAIVIASGYYAGALDYPALKAFFLEVAEASPIPIMIYNCEFRGHFWAVTVGLVLTTFFVSRPWRGRRNRARL